MVKVTIEINGKVTDVLTGDYVWGVIGDEKAYTYANSGFVKGVTNRRALILSMIYTMPQLVQSITKDDPGMTDLALKKLQQEIYVVRASMQAGNTGH